MYAGLAGGYLIRDTTETGIDTGAPDGAFPAGKHEVPLIIQDKIIGADGQQVYDNGTWMPEFFGDTPVINGIAFPFLSVDKGVYRFRAYNGSQARFYRMSLKVKSTGAVLPFFQIGSDGGPLNQPVPLTQLVLEPGERADLLVDFRGLNTGELVEMGNNAPTPFPNGPKNAHKGGVPIQQLVQFRVTGTTGWRPWPRSRGMNLRPIIPITRLNPGNGVKVRTHSLVEIMGAGRSSHGAAEQPQVPRHLRLPGRPGQKGHPRGMGVHQPTVDSHPIHLHLVQFQVLNRQLVDTVAYLAASGYDLNKDGMLTEDEVGKGTYPAPAPAAAQLIGAPQLPTANEMGWKDTVVVPPGMVTRIAVPFGSGAASTPIAARSFYVPNTTRRRPRTTTSGTATSSSTRRRT